ncbi:hypothetical protein QHH_38 [Halomonas phage QHHSV-1]|nr:hypothetical protein QHH_38 [Halomonas phage QHHSV-1]
MTTLSLESLRDQGAFTKGALVPKEITWKREGQEYTYTVYVRPLSYYTTVSELRASAGEDALAGRIAASICQEDGTPVFRASDITGFHADGSPVLELDAAGNPVQEVDENGDAVHDEDGEPVYRERGSLCSELSFALLAAIGEVNWPGKTTS